MSDQKIFREKSSTVKLYGNNSLKTRELFETKTSYKNHALLVSPFFVPTEASNFLPQEQAPVVDYYLEERSLYGKVNINYQSILPRKEKLSFSSTGNSAIALNFVMMAAKQMNDRVRDLLQAPGFFKVNDTLFEEFSIEKGYENPENIINNVYLDYESAMKPEIAILAVNNKIRDIKDYINFYINRLMDIYDGTPFFKSQIITSGLNSSLNTGLAIEINSGRYDDDSFKIQKFYRSINFEAYKTLALKHGFKIDKNIPWRLVADITTPQMKYFMVLANRDLLTVNLQNINTILDYFFVPVQDDYFVFEKFMIDSYNSFVVSKPTAKIIRGHYCNQDVYYNLNRKVINSYSISYELRYFLLQKYTFLKAKMSSINLSQEDTKVLFQTVGSILQSLGIIQAINYLESKLQTIQQYNGSNTYEAVKKALQDTDSQNQNPQEIIARKIRAGFYDIY